MNFKSLLLSLLPLMLSVVWNLIWPSVSFGEKLVAVEKPNCTTSSCHSEIKHFSKLHGPNKANGCTVCHRKGSGNDSNASFQKPLPSNHPSILPILPKDVNTTCLTCHEDKTGKGFAFTHKAITEKTCVSCHNSHGSNGKHLLKVEPLTELCFSCHKDVKEQNHGGHQKVLNQDKACFNCHEVHFSHEPKLLKLKISSLCLQCHNKEIITANGETLANIQKVIENRPHLHKPVEEGKCQSCHIPHGSGDKRFLTKVYTKTEPKLCAECHKSLNSETRTFDATTNFRNGTTNLHNFHLNEVKTPLNCQTCHEVHASTQDLLIRSTTDYNSWKLPIQYTKLPSGGTCLTACHKDKTYNRTTPFSNEVGR